MQAEHRKFHGGSKLISLIIKYQITEWCFVYIQEFKKQGLYVKYRLIFVIHCVNASHLWGEISWKLWFKQQLLSVVQELLPADINAQHAFS
jgi:hypothetical protein